MDYRGPLGSISLGTRDILVRRVLILFIEMWLLSGIEDNQGNSQHLTGGGDKVSRATEGETASRWMVRNLSCRTG